MQIVKRPDFKALPTDRFNGENRGKTFNKVDEQGPVIVRGGGYTLLANDNSTLSRLLVDSDGILNSYNGFADNSDDSGRVVVVPREASAQILEASLEELQAMRDREIKRAQSAYERAEKAFREALLEK